jgi:ectoine hydroxylase-related dioxygenase (phytanoyl-CoA dioxygenase family)
MTHTHTQQDSSQLKSISASLRDDGFVSIKDFFTQKELESFEECIVDLYLLQAKKISDYRQRAIEIESSGQSNFEKFSSIYELMEANDKEALYQVQKFLPSSPTARKIFNDRFTSLTEALLCSPSHNLLIDGPALFVNRPRTERLLYKWHSEAHYYPKRRRFLNIWLPLFTKKTKDNGTMSFRVASHKRDFPFSDYQGYNKDTQNKANYFIQYEIPENLVLGYREHWCEVEPKDLVIFDRSMVHTSNQNISDHYSVAVVARVWDPSEDLTLSGSMAATPYGGNIGRPGLVVDLLD